jgi:hypothetical protein
VFDHLGIYQSRIDSLAAGGKLLRHPPEIRMAPNAKSRSNALDDRFELEETFLSSPSALALKSAVLRGTDRRSGEPVVVKYCQKTGSPVDAEGGSNRKRQPTHALS